MEQETNVYDALSNVQARLAVPKNFTNSFGGYKFRSLEDIHAAAKPIVREAGAVYFLTDSVEKVDERYYVKATACFVYKGEVITVEASAREALSKKGMDDAQVTGLASSYARKYALQGLFALDGDADPDQLDNREEPRKSDELGGLMAVFAEMRGRDFAEVREAVENKIGARVDKMDSQQNQKAVSLVKAWIDQAGKKE